MQILADMKENLNNALKKDYGKKTHVTTAFDWAQAKSLVKRNMSRKPVYSVMHRKTEKLPIPTLELLLRYLLLLFVRLFNSLKAYCVILTVQVTIYEKWYFLSKVRLTAREKKKKRQAIGRYTQTAVYS
ncbi:hypothetical protein HPB48_004995 [Haemaphysalis longicornis]|uniref:Uncharacterized protein n=1 Tax=Haemaphysalis longicornis TaxID=44386 RepID=A0A9J6GD04_HAELO|nr:hypothetical protein HPB48_004995 [Haemaphysalis longicornis]